MKKTVIILYFLLGAIINIFGTNQLLTNSQIEIAIQWALEQKESPKQNWENACLEFVSSAFQEAGLKNSGSTTAKNASDKMIQYKDKFPPRGAVVFYDWIGTIGGVTKNWGHVAISLGNGKIIHAMNEIVISNIEFTSKDHKYLGWGYWNKKEYEPIIDGIYYINVPETNLVFDVKEENTEKGVEIIVYPIHRGDNQRFKIEKINSGEYIIKNIMSKKVIVVKDTSEKISYQIQQGDYNSENSCMRWKIHDIGNGLYRFMNVCTKTVLDLSNDQKIQVRESNNSKTQHYKLIKDSQKSYTVTVLAETGGVIKIKGNKSYSMLQCAQYFKDEQILIEACPLEGFSFIGWFDSTYKKESNELKYSTQILSERQFIARFNKTENNKQNIKTPLGAEMIYVNGGSFYMGNTRNDKEGKENEIPINKINLSYDYWIGETEVTFDEYDMFCEATGREKPFDGMYTWLGECMTPMGRGTRPVINVTKKDAMEYCNWLSRQQRIPIAYDNYYNLIDESGMDKVDISEVCGYRLPTEAEWEYAARGGHKDILDGNENKDYRYAGHGHINEVAWYGANSDNQLHPVKMKKPNELGLYDITGNVREWVYDLYTPYEEYTYNNPICLDKEYQQLLRGGCYQSNEDDSRIVFRDVQSISNPRLHSCGFRIVRTVIEH